MADDRLPTLNQLLVRRFLVFLVLAIGVIALVCVIVVVASANATLSAAEQALLDQVDRNSDKVMGDIVIWLQSYLSSVNHGYLAFAVNALNDTRRSGYSMDPVTSWRDNGNENIPPPGVFIDRQPKVVSLTSSMYYIPGTPPSTPLTASQADFVQRSAHLDAFTKPLYTTNEDVFAIYVAHADTGTLRSYPGKSTLEEDPTRSYEPRTRPWYTAAMALSEGQTHYTPPYQDFNSRLYMVTVSQKLPEARGVAGVDVLLRTITESISSVRFLSTGKLSLFERTGEVVADEEWVLADAPGVIRYSDLVNPTISAEHWTHLNTATATDSRSLTFTMSDGQKWWCLARGVARFPNYLVVTFVPFAEVEAPAQGIRDQIGTAQGVVIGIVIAVAVVMGLLQLIIGSLLGSGISKPLAEMNANIGQMVRNIGHPALMRGVEPVSGGVGDEQEELGKEFNAMVATLRRQRVKGVLPNEYAGGVHPHLIPPNGPGTRVFPDGCEIPAHMKGSAV